MSKFLINCNSNIICCIDCETTGPEAGYHDIIQVCILALDSKLKSNKSIIPFYCDLKPKRPENFEPLINPVIKNKLKVTLDRFADVTNRGLDPYVAADLFDTWFEKLDLLPGKRIIPLAHNWPYDQRFIIDWLGEKSFESYFDSRYRDTQAVAVFLNDCAEFHIEQPPHPKVNLSYLASIYRIPHERRHDALADCVITAELYRTIIKSSLFRIKDPLEPPKDVPDTFVDNTDQCLKDSWTKKANEQSQPGTLKHLMISLGKNPESEDDAQDMIRKLISINDWYMRNR